MTRLFEENKGTTIQDEGINLIYFFNIFLRNRLLISAVALLSIILSSLYAILSKKVWEGQFQIVINQENKSPNLNPQLASLAGISLTTGNELNTEVEILKSPSVLMPVFEFAKSQKNQSIKNQLRFSSWKKNNLDIELEQNTSVLNISYRNVDKKTIIPVLNKMSSSYQKYSGKNKRRTQELTNNFLKEQISIFKKKSANSLRSAQEYALEQDLVFYDLEKQTQNNIDNNSNNLRSNALEAPNLLLPNIGIENARVQAANEIRKINLQLQKIQELNDSEELQYIGSTIPALVNEGLPKALSDIEAALLEAKSKYTDKDITIENLIKQRNFVIKLLKSRTIKYLEVQKLNAESTMKAALRPKGVLLKYKELIREAARDEQTLIQLEDRFNFFKLGLATQEDPWELITKPTLTPTPIAPNKKNIISIYTFLGVLCAYIYAFIKEKKSGLIYEKKILEDILKVNILDIYQLSRKELKINSLKTFQEEILDLDPKSKIKIIKSSAIKEEDLKFALDIIFASKNQYEVVETFRKIENEKILLIVDLASANYEEVENLKNRLKYNKKTLFGILLFE